MTERTYPTPAALDCIAAFLGGYTSTVDRIALPRVVAQLQDRFDRFTIDGVIAGRLLRRVGFQRSYEADDRGPIIIYRRRSATGRAA